MPLYTAFVGLTKVFDLVNRDGLFKFLPKIGCPPKLQSMIESFHSDSKGTVQFNVSPSEPLEIRSGVKQGCVLAATLFGIFFGMLLNMPRHNNRRNLPSYSLRWHALQPHPSQSQDKGTPGSHQGHAVCWWLAVATHTQDELQSLMDCFSHAYNDFGLTISLKKANVLGQDTEARRSLSLTTTNSTLSASSHSSAPPSLTTISWTQKSTRG